MTSLGTQGSLRKDPARSLSPSEIPPFAFLWVFGEQRTAWPRSPEGGLPLVQRANGTMLHRGGQGGIATGFVSPRPQTRGPEHTPFKPRCRKTWRGRSWCPDILKNEGESKEHKRAEQRSQVPLGARSGVNQQKGARQLEDPRITWMPTTGTAMVSRQSPASATAASPPHVTEPRLRPLAAVIPQHLAPSRHRPCPQSPPPPTQPREGTWRG